MSPYMQSLRKAVGPIMLQVPYVGAWITDESGRVLLAQHARDGLWGLIGGAAEPEEVLECALRREVAEETGLVISVHGVHSIHSGPHTTVTYDSGDQVSAVAIVFHCTIAQEGPLAADDDEVLQVRWIHTDELQDLPQKPWLVHVLNAAVETDRA